MGGQIALGRVEVAGCIASGKTTLVRSLANHFNPVYEDHRLNPFWAAFYADPSTCAFETEITFLLQHYHFAKVGTAGLRKTALLDHSFELDLAYARVGLKGARRRIFESIYGEIEKELGPPRMIVVINCAAEVLVRRIQERGRGGEAAVPLEFLLRLQHELDKRIEEVQGLVKIVRVDSEHNDFRRKGDWLLSLESVLGDQRE